MEPVKILLSQAAALGDFEQLVKDHIERLEAHRLTVGEARPVAHPLVEAAISRIQYPKADVYQPTVTYEMEVPDPEGEEGSTKKVTVTEPAGEPVHFTSSDKPDDFIPNYVLVDDTPAPLTLEERKMQRSAALTAEANAVLNTLAPPLKMPLWQMNYMDALNVPEDKRTADDTATIEQWDARTKKANAVQRHLAQLQSDLHDLSEADFDKWEPAPFPG